MAVVLISMVEAIAQFSVLVMCCGPFDVVLQTKKTARQDHAGGGCVGLSSGFALDKNYPVHGAEERRRRLFHMYIDTDLMGLNAAIAATASKNAAMQRDAYYFSGLSQRSRK
jgi:hypothetical protein